ncbi:MAG TPA: PorP/SprF family type IX secretion system membrane protein [Bacteroidia bacterium]|nr:PorP/SprF family type IX secretion system membrane protein [Bacteroidia bacterium]
MKKKLIIFYCVMHSLISSLNAQDFHLSMYDAGPLFLNPALTGVVDANFRVHAQYRNQWRSVAFKPYNTALISLDAPKGKWGFGGQIVNMRAGVGNYNVLQGLFSVSYAVPLDKNKFHNLSFGIQAGATQKRIEAGLYTYNNQYTNTNGGYFNQDLPSGETFNRQSFVTEQVNAGFMYFNAKQQSRLNPFLGYSVFNLTNPRETFYQTNNKLPIRHYVHAGLRININELFYILPKALVMMQKNATEQLYSIDAGYYFKEQEFYLLAGLNYRSKDAAVVYVGARKNNYIAKIGYDANTSSLKDVSKYRGAFEISFTYMAKKSKPKELRHCPRL